jgi:hypothetical protein
MVFRQLPSFDDDLKLMKVSLSIKWQPTGTQNLFHPSANDHGCLVTIMM